MKFTAVVTAHENFDGLMYVRQMLEGQTRQPDEILVFYSDMPEVCIVGNPRPNQNDWGHAKRAEGLEVATGDWVGFFNDDDSYAPDYIEKMLSATESADVVYCGWSGKTDCTFNLGSSTSGNFIVRTDFGRWVGYHSRRYEADGDFIEECRAHDARIRRVDDILYAHNIQPWERYVGRAG